MIETVCGKLSREELGIILPHEHIFIDMRKCVEITGNEPQIFYDKVSCKNRAEIFADPYAILDNALLDEEALALYELMYFKMAGGCTIVDCTPDEIGRDAEKLRELSVKSGVNIIAGCGHYYDKAHFSCVDRMSADMLADEMIRDITVGIGNTQIKAGVIGEIGTSAVITKNERKVLCGAGIAGAKTDKAIHVHTDLYTQNGFEIIDILTSYGVKPEKICINHVDVLLRHDYIRALLEKGVYVEFDNFGKEFYVNEKKRFAYDRERVLLLKELFDEGYKHKILVTNDICLKSMWRAYGGNGYAHVLRSVRYMAHECGISDEDYMNTMSENVKRFLI